MNAEIAAIAASEFPGLRVYWVRCFMGLRGNHGTESGVFLPDEGSSNLGGAEALRPPGFAKRIALTKADPRILRQREAPLLNSAQVAGWLGVSQRTVCLWAELSEIPGFKLGHQWRFREDDIRSWLQSYLAPPKSRSEQSS